jgi:hypothetical protein
MTELVITRLTRAMGRTAGMRCVEELLAQLGLTEIRTPSELLDFANSLCQRGGINEVVGSSLRVTALLRGARAR